MRNFPMRSSRALVLLLAPALLLASSARAQMGPSAVVVAPVEERPLQLTQPLVASIEAVTRSRLAAEQGGLVVERNFDDGQPVEKGQVLAKLKTDVLEAQLASAKAAVSSADASVAKAEAEVANARAKADRARKLYESNALGGEELRDAETAEKVKEADVALQKAVVLEKQAEVDRLQLLIRQSIVIAPIHGVVSKRHVETGQWIEQGAAVADVVWLDPLHVRVNVPESVMPQLKATDQAAVQVDALPGQTFTAVVDQVMPEADPASRSFIVKLKLANPGGKLRPGFFARATLQSMTGATLQVPKDAVVQRGPAAHVVVAREGKAVIVPVVRTGASNDRIAVQPAPGQTLTGKDMVVTRGNEGLRGGEQLMVVGTAPGGPPASAPATQPATEPATQPAP